MRITTAFDEMYRTDIGFIADAGLSAYRFSFAWPRVQPEGKGPPNLAGLDLYDRIVDAMLARGLEPWATTFHWDIPAALGDWRDRDLAFRYSDYAEILARRFGDRVHRWIVLNEPGVVAMFGYGLGAHAPGVRSKDAWAAAAHHQNLAQGLGFQALRQNLSSACRVGTTLSLQPMEPANGLESSKDAAATLDAIWNGAFLQPLFGRLYPERLQDVLRPLIRPGDMATIAAAPDFLGVNYYSRIYAVSAPESPLGFEFGAAPPQLQRNSLGWSIEPDGLEEILLMLKESYGNPPVVVTEFGATFADPQPTDGIVDDPRRVDFIRNYLEAIGAALRRGADIRGAFYWSATDNWEWGEGFTAHFGLIQVDRATLQRTPKKSLAYYGQFAVASG